MRIIALHERGVTATLFRRDLKQRYAIQIHIIESEDAILWPIFSRDSISSNFQSLASVCHDTKLGRSRLRQLRERLSTDRMILIERYTENSPYGEQDSKINYTFLQSRSFFPC